MLSGGAEALIKFWDLESAENTSNHFTYRPSAILQKQEPRTHQSKEQSRTSHNFGITHLSFYPFDSQAFLSSSYDHTLKIYATETLSPSASFDLNSTIYSHALSPIADHLLVACATQHPAIRLVDLRSGASAHSLPGHQGAVLSVSWSPRNEHVLASGGSDGTARLWDIRRSAGSLGVLDLEDSVGIGGEDGLGKNARQREHGKAHIGACNGVVWTDSGNHLVTAGHDERVRVWDVSTGANALSHFGPTIKNTHRSSLLPLLPPSHITPPGKQTMLYPNEKDLLLFDLFDGTLLKRLRSPGAAVAQARGAAGQRNVRHRITALAWRAGDVKVYSAHSDGVVRGWVGDDGGVEDEEEKEESGDEGRERKRRALDGVFRELTGRKITFN
ncbi:hypothetical protein MMC12_007610 [Toensbergia leucococca]|nr:hypothetical protein [Toensbergia leucococca]